MLREIEEKLDGMVRQRAAAMIEADYDVVTATLDGFWLRIGGKYPGKQGLYDIRDLFYDVKYDIKILYEYVTGGKDIKTRREGGPVNSQMEALKGIGDYYLEVATDQILSELLPGYKPEPKESAEPQPEYEVTVAIKGSTGPAPTDVYPLLDQVEFDDGSDIGHVKMTLEQLQHTFPFIGRVDGIVGYIDAQWNGADWTVGDVHYNVMRVRKNFVLPEARYNRVKDQFRIHVKKCHPELDYCMNREEFLGEMVDHMAGEICRLESITYLEED